ncbi:uveal autoantigen with coiled-coil domains and ankyrin repeats protein isoform X2 [Hypomesus transpacificus]|uniref:uveal autoantigen with coiled-coil domains and ankyrin repeats protein isoform X2 n=1 Tax=Hypomesus transpacificus TaxID=137520 RepID=UPI001F07DDF8|nr:uveal autoantigen with coiled-coil domains and ankyrin repeats protein isoform X2 [Hypomesus transpacificus]
MKSLKYRLKKHEVTITNTDWNKYDDRLMKAVERGEVDKVAAVLSKKGIIPSKLDVEGRSAFHLAATRGHLDCLNLILGHNVDVTATDATGKNALHLASRNGQSLCVQKLLQHNCPVGNVDLQGRTALHDAVMAGCSSSVKLLCDSGVSVNASDFDGRTPLVLATQMCHPRICQLLLERGADIGVRDKQNKTALILGCEYACTDAVEVLLKCGADVTAVDTLGHDGYHYARLSKNPELVRLVKTYLDGATKVKEAAKMEQKKRQQSVEITAESEANMKDLICQDLERQNENQQETLRRFHQEQRALLDKVNILQQQLTQEKLTVEDIHKEREHLKLLLSAKEREEGARGMETVKVQLRSTLGDYSGQSVIKGKDNILVKQSHSLDSAQILQPAGPSHSQSRPLELGRPSVGWDPAREVDSFQGELEAMRKQQQSLENETARLQVMLSRKNQECQELAQSRDTVQRQADRQVQDLEEALGDVQKRMLDSESKVKQLQAHVVAVKEHLGGQAAEELRAQLQDVKAKYEGASAEVGRVRNHLKQSEKALEEYKSSEGQLAAEAERLGQDLGALREERDELAEALLEMEAHMKEAQGRMLAAVVPAEKFDNMKNLLSNAVDEKERQLAELREDYDRVLEEVADLHREMDKLQSPPDGRGTVPTQEHERVRAGLEEQNASLKRRLADVTAKSQALICEVEESEEEREMLREQLDELNSRLEVDFVSVKAHEEAKMALSRAMEELEDKLVEATEKTGNAEAQIQRLQTERVSLNKNVTNLQSANVASHKIQGELDVLTSRNDELLKELEVLQKKCENQERELGQVVAENVILKQNLEGEDVCKKEHKQIKSELNTGLEKAKAEISKLKKKDKESEEELRNVKEDSAKLKVKLEVIQVGIEKEYISLKDHETMKWELSNAIVKLENQVKTATARYESAHEETIKLNHEMEAQKKELDTIQEAIQSKFIPLTVVEEKENSYNAKIKDLTTKLSEMQEKYNCEKSGAERNKQEKDQLKLEMESVQDRLKTGFIPSEKHKEVEEKYNCKIEELTLKLMDMEQQYKEVTVQRAELEEQNALCKMEIQNLQQRIESELAKLERFETEHQVLRDTIQQAQAECHKSKEAQHEESQRACALEKELQARSGDHALLLQQHAQALAGLEAEVVKYRQALQEEEESSAQRTEDVSALQSELLRANQALEELRGKEYQVSQLRAEKQRLEEELAEMGNKLSGLANQCTEFQCQVGQAQEGEGRARMETEALQEKSQAIEKEIKELKERYNGSLGTIEDLQTRIRTSAEQTEIKDMKITELLTDIERLKQALNGLSQLAYAGNAPNKRQTQLIDTLQAQIKTLQQQLADAERQHRDVVSIYRTHLLSAAQGHMDEDVQAALLQIIRMRQEFVC